MVVNLIPEEQLKRLKRGRRRRALKVLCFIYVILLGLGAMAALFWQFIGRHIYE